MFPPELIAEIAKHLATEYMALRHCSLVSREWAASCRPWLFRNVAIPLADCERFWALMRSPYNTFVNCVSHVNFLGSDQKFEIYTELGSTLAKSIPHFPNARSLRVSQDDIEDEEELDVFLSWIALKVPHIVDLSLCSMAVPRLRYICVLVCQFSDSLESLSLQNVGWPAMDVCDDLIPPTQLKTLRLWHCYMPDILGWVLNNRLLPSTPIQTIALASISSSTIDSLSCALAVARSNLRHLSFAFREVDAGGTAESFADAIDLGSNTNLQTIRLALDLSSYYFSSPFPHLTRIISQLTHLPELVKVSFQLSYTHSSHIDGLFLPSEDATEQACFWENLDALAGNQDNFPRLRSLVFEVSSESYQGSHDLEHALRMKMPRISKRGILRLKVEGVPSYV